MQMHSLIEADYSLENFGSKEGYSPKLGREKEVFEKIAPFLDLQQYEELYPLHLKWKYKENQKYPFLKNSHIFELENLR